MKILVTGATGFIGGHLIDKLIQKKHLVWAIVRKNSDKKITKDLVNKGVKIIIGDLKNLDRIKLPTVDCVYHLAALVDTIDIYSYDKLYKENTLPTMKLADHYLGKVKKFIFLSSMSAIGVTNLDKKITEETETNPKSNYGRSKLAAENYLLKLYTEKKFPVTIFRPPTVYGPGEHYNFLKLTKAIQAKRYWILGNGENSTSWCYVENLVEALVVVLHNKYSSGQVFLIDDGVSYTLKEISERIAVSLGINLPKIKIPLPAAYLMAILLELFSFMFHSDPPLSRKRINTLTSNFTFNISKAQKLLGYKPPVKLNEAITRTITYFQKTGQLGTKHDELEIAIIQGSKNEGLGSIYERIMLKRLFEKFIKKYKFASVLEYKGLKITKGLDNLTFEKNGKKITTSDNELIRKQKFDLVWNFATVQIEQDVIRQVKNLSDKYVLIFVPNFYTIGMPFHLAYHLIIKRECNHAERGSIILRTKQGIEKLVKKNGLKIIESGYVDLPLLPDIGFSIRELKGELGMKLISKKNIEIVNIEDEFNLVQKLGAIERLNLPNVLKFPLAHHIYVLAKVK